METPKILSEEEIKAGLAGLPGWSFADDKISKEYKFNDFLDALKFINGMAPYFEEMDHHPDMHISYSRVTFELQRFDIGGKVTDRDIIVAKEIEQRFHSR